jgi:hypothetical protein
MALGQPPASAERPPVSPQVVGDSGSIRGRRWADVADEVDTEEAALAELAAWCSPPVKPSLAEFVAVARHVRRQRGKECCGGAGRSPSRSSASSPLRGVSSPGGCGPRLGASSALASAGGAVLACDRALERSSEVPVLPPSLAVAAPGEAPPPPSSSSAPERGVALGALVGLGGPASARRPIVPWRSQDARLRSGPPGPLRPIGAWLWLQKGVASLDVGFPAPADQVRRHASHARQVRQHPPPPPLRRSFAAALMKRGRSPSPSESPPVQHPRRVRAVSPRPAAPAPYRPPARRRSPALRSPARTSGRDADRVPARRESPARRASPGRRSPPGHRATGRRDDQPNRGRPRSPPRRSPRARSPGRRARSPRRRGPSPEATRQELALREQV